MNPEIQIPPINIRTPLDNAKEAFVQLKKLEAFLATTAPTPIWSAYQNGLNQLKKAIAKLEYESRF